MKVTFFLLALAGVCAGDSKIYLKPASSYTATYSYPTAFSYVRPLVKTAAVHYAAPVAVQYAAPSVELSSVEAVPAAVHAVAAAPAAVQYAAPSVELSSVEAVPAAVHAVAAAPAAVQYAAPSVKVASVAAAPAAVHAVAAAPAVPAVTAYHAVAAAPAVYSKQAVVSYDVDDDDDLKVTPYGYVAEVDDDDDHYVVGASPVSFRAAFGDKHDYKPVALTYAKLDDDHFEFDHDDRK